MTAFLYFLFAVLFIYAAHLIRVLRWELFIDTYEKPDHKSLIRALAIGYLLNCVLPFKLGDLVRAFLAGRKMKNGKPLGLSTVIVDRYLDIVFVGVIFILLSLTGIGSDAAKNTAVFYVILSASLLFLIAAVYLFKGTVKRIIRTVAGLFNDSIEAALLRTAWALIWNFKDIFQKISKGKLLFTTVGMWSGYLISYSLFAGYLRSLGGAQTATWQDVFMTLFTQNGIRESTGAMTLFGHTTVAARPVSMLLYMVIPLIALLVTAPLFKKELFHSHDEEIYLNLMPLLDPKERLAFLETYFSNTDRDYMANYLRINQNISIIRDYSAGSNATTILCTDGEKTFFRKYAFGEDGRKLGEQIRWLSEYQTLPFFPRILRQEQTELYCYYDMPYNSNSVGLFEYAHSTPPDQSFAMIRNALTALHDSIYRMNEKKADPEAIRRYIEVKVTRNLNTIRNARRIRNLQAYDTIVINGTACHNLAYYESWLSEKYLEEVFRRDPVTAIHGDLTVENIVCTRDASGNDGFYIIDPNTGNILDSPYLDYAKLLQSIHGGYEFLMSVKEVSVEENRINFLFTNSSAYAALHEKLRTYMLSALGEEAVKSVYFHEIVHWLRLLPYKIEKDIKTAPVFYAGLLMVLKDVIRLYGGDMENE